jgi:diguanylate cyclase (GGDEF)-like protein
MPIGQKRRRFQTYATIFVIFAVINFLINYTIYSDSRDAYLEDKLETLTFQYSTITGELKEKSDIYFEEIINQDNILHLLYKLNSSNIDSRREELLHSVSDSFKRMQERSVRQFHFHTKDNISFLRVHKPEKFGDSLVGIRYSVEEVNRHQKSLHGFEEGRIYNGFRNVYPLIYKGEHLGSAEISFSFNAVSHSLQDTFRGNYTFIISKKLVDERVFNPSENYIVSSLDSHFYSEKEYINSRERDDRERFLISSEINRKLAQEFNRYHLDDNQKPFSKLITHNGDDYIVSFLPVSNIKGEAGVAYIVNYLKDSFIPREFQKFIAYIIIADLIAIIVIYLIINHVRQEEFAFINGLLENQSNLIFVKSRDDIIKVNSRLLQFFGYSSLYDLQRSNHTICDFFIKDDGFLYKPDGSGDEFLTEQLRDHPDANFKVKMVDQTTKLVRIFTINMAHLKEQDLYLVILSDITPNELEKKAIEDKASRDKLTTLYNRAKFEVDLQESILRRVTFSLVLMDLDGFSKINEDYGHMAGDKLLIELSSLIDDNIRKSDIIYRWGGDEVILMVNDKMLSATKLAEKLRGLIDNHRFYKEIPLNASFGVTEHRKFESSEEIIARAEKALHTAKLSGKNCVITC